MEDKILIGLSLVAGVFKVISAGIDLLRKFTRSQRRKKKKAVSLEKETALPEKDSRDSSP